MIGLVHLVWAPLGVEPVDRFLASYRRHPAGVEHELVIALNGTGEEGFLDALTERLAATPHRLLELERPVLDLAAYGHAAKALTHERLCLLNSYSEIQADDWLAKLSDALDRPQVGLAGATGSWESQSEWHRGRLRWWPYQLARVPLDRRSYPRFPNAHIRTTGFIARREQLLDARLHEASSKPATYLIESGFHSLTARLRESGERAVVVGRDGTAYEQDQWPDSATYRSHGQRDLLISDNRTREWDAAPPHLKERLTRDAWGSRGSV